MMSATMKYGDYQFSPVPFLDIQKRQNKTGDGTLVGTTFAVTLGGTLTDLVTQQFGGTGLCALDAGEVALRQAFNQDGKLFLLTCDDCVMISGYPRVGDIQFNRTNNNWVYTKDFTIEIEYDDDPVGAGENTGLMPPYINEASESWQVEFLQDRSKYGWTLTTGYDSNPYQLRLTHNVSAVGKRHYRAAGLQKPAWEQARDYVHGRLGYDSQFITQSGFFNLDASQFSAYNHVRSNNIGELAGSYDATESWIVINPSGSGIAGRALEDFTVSIRNAADTGLSTVSIEGSVNGLETVSYSPAYSVTETKYDAALGYWGTVQGRLYSRCTHVATGSARPFNVLPVAQTVTHNPPGGIITYSYEYNDRPSNCISGALSEVFQETWTFPSDVFATLTVLGRTQGPILQDIGAVTAPGLSLNVELVMQPATGCPTTAQLVAAIRGASPRAQVDTIVAAYEADLSSNYSQVFRTNHSESWEYKQGRYTRNISWQFMDCE